MKKLILLITTMAMVISLSAFTYVTDTSEIDYMSLMMQAVANGDKTAGIEAEDLRTDKIVEFELKEKIIGFDDLNLLSKIIYAEAGSEWLSDDWKMCVGEVVLNRVDSPEFPNSVREVIYQDGQYYGANSDYFETLKPSMRCIELAKRLLSGDRIINDSSVVFQANFKQGSGTHTAIYDRYLGWTYFCYSSHQELYKSES